MLIVKVPGLNNLGKNNGCRNAGNAILSKLTEVYSNESNKPIHRRLLNIEEIHVDNFNIEEQNKLIFDNTKKILEESEKTLFLGGDHSISYSIGKAFLENCRDAEKEPCLIVFDAHADCMQAMREPTHEGWLRGLVEFGFPKENILLVGIRNLWQDEIKFLSENKIRRINMGELCNNLEEITDTIMEFASGKELYVSFDIDVVDPAFAPSTGHTEVGGLTSRQALYIIARIAKMKNLKVFDLVEINSEKDECQGWMTVKLGAKLVGELL